MGRVRVAADGRVVSRRGQRSRHARRQRARRQNSSNAWPRRDGQNRSRSVSTTGGTAVAGPHSSAAPSCADPFTTPSCVSRNGVGNRASDLRDRAEMSGPSRPVARGLRRSAGDRSKHAHVPLGTLRGRSGRLRRGHGRTARRGRSGPLAAAGQLRRCAAASAAGRGADGAPRLAGAGARPRPAARRRHVRRAGLGRGARPARRRTHQGVRRAGPRGGVRRFLRLVKRRPVPPRAEPAAPLPELPRRLRPLAAARTASVRRRCCSRGSSAAGPTCCGRSPRGRCSPCTPSCWCASAASRRRTSRWRQAGSPSTVPWRTSRTWCAAAVRSCSRGPDRADGPRGLAARWLPVRPGTDVALMRGAVPGAGRRRPARRRVPRHALRGRRRGVRPTSTAGPTASTRPRVGRRRSAGCPRTRSSPSPARWRRSARW